MKLAVALSQRAASLGRRGADRDVSGRGIGAPGRGHHGGIVGHARVSPSTVSDLNKKILRDDRGVAQSSDRGATWPPFARPRSSSLRNAERSVSPLIALPVRGLITSWQMSSCGKPKPATRSNGLAILGRRLEGRHALFVDAVFGFGPRASGPLREKVTWIAPR